MLSKCFFIQLAVIGGNIKTHPAVMYFDRLLEVVNVDKLNVKLVVKMFYFLELFFGEWLACGLLKTMFVLS